MRFWRPLLWYCLIFVTSCTVVHRDAFVASVGTVLPGPMRSGWDGLWSHAWWLFVKGWHAAEFAILFVLIRRLPLDGGWSLFLVSLAASLDEFHQTFVPGRGGVVSDVLIDTGGAILAAILLQAKSAPRRSVR